MVHVVDALTFPDEIKKLSWLPTSIKEDLLESWREYNSMRAILHESLEVVSYHDKPTSAIDLAMQKCAAADRTIQNQLIGIQNSFRDPKSEFYSKAWRDSIVGQAREKCGMAELRESVLLLHHLVSSMRTAKQLDSMMSHFLGPMAPLETDDDSGSVVRWYPRQHRTSISRRSVDFSIPDEQGEPFTKPPQDHLAESNYTFDAVITQSTSAGITYIPARGLWDTGSNDFMISRQLLDRTKFTADDMTPVNDVRIDGVGGAICKPGHSIILTWYVNRNMNSRQDRFYVHEEHAPFDILVPHNLIIGSRYTGIGEVGQTALVLQLRHKTKTERDQDKINEALAEKQAGEKRKRRLDEATEQRKIQRSERELLSRMSTADDACSSSSLSHESSIEPVAVSNEM